MLKNIFNISALTFVLLLSLTASGQKFSKKCKTCGKAIAQCRYKGVHPRRQSELVIPVRQETPVHKPENSIQVHGNGDMTFVVDDVSFKMVKVESGTFQMGATSEQGSDAYSDEMPVHSVSVSDYYICQTEVTQALWQVVMGSNPSYDRGNNKPVEQVSWDDCQEFIKKMNKKTGREFRLPTEAEWEYAARGGRKSRGYKYSGSNILGSVAWYDNNSNNTIHDVASKQPNELGLYDMSGNVWEWCQDRIGKYSSEAKKNPIGAVSGAIFVNRGGGAKTVDKSCRVSVRMGDKAFTKGGYLGLRLVLSSSGEISTSGSGVPEDNLNANANFQKATELYENKEYSQAVDIFRRLAIQGHAKAQCYLGDCYYYGNGIPKDDKTAIHWWTEAATQGLAVAQNNLGVSYEYGEGVSKDLQKAAFWYEKAANQGNADAQYNLGVCYDNGDGVPKDPQKAVSWYEKAANQEFAQAQYDLGVCYENGIGVEKDPLEAAYWKEKYKGNPNEWRLK